MRHHHFSPTAEETGSLLWLSAKLTLNQLPLEKIKAESNVTNGACINTRAV